MFEKIWKMHKPRTVKCMNLALLYLCYGVGASTLGGASLVLFVVNGSIMLVFSHSVFRVEYSHIQSPSS